MIPFFTPGSRIIYLSFRGRCGPFAVKRLPNDDRPKLNENFLRLTSFFENSTIPAGPFPGPIPPKMNDKTADNEMIRKTAMKMMMKLSMTIKTMA